MNTHNTYNLSQLEPVLPRILSLDRRLSQTGLEGMGQHEEGRVRARIPGVLKGQ